MHKLQNYTFYPSINTVYYMPADLEKSQMLSEFLTHLGSFHISKPI